ncbi:energy-coupling factor ABC transporter ATP-binding protein [Slackia heliotrinireducens]|uniref:energy-coupling factor ABC transporter ATP-binding protein n=1 Tax=Slackia heliotrinireducens TaxID=84110 RepID=UPI003315ABF4
MIEFQHVSASYDEQIQILRDVSFTIQDGDFVAFVGTNGAGKSTTMRLMNGLIKPESGTVLIDGVPTTELRTSELARRVGFLFQNPDNQICCNTVREELLFGFKATGADMAQAEQRVDRVIEQFAFNPDDDPFMLNRGTRQLLALASVIVMEPPVVVLDEPTTGLDFRECIKVMDIIRGLYERGTTIVMVCHDMEVVGDFAKSVIVMSAGKVVDQGETFAILRNRETLAKASLIPPQIVDISMGLSIMHPELAATPIAQANDLRSMESAILNAAQGGANRE